MKFVVHSPSPEMAVVEAGVSYALPKLGINILNRATHLLVYFFKQGNNSWLGNQIKIKKSQSNSKTGSMDNSR